MGTSNPQLVVCVCDGGGGGGGVQSCGTEPLTWGRQGQNRVEFLDTLLCLGTVCWCGDCLPCWNWVQEPNLRCLPRLHGNDRPHAKRHK